MFLTGVESMEEVLVTILYRQPFRSQHNVLVTLSFTLDLVL